MSPLFGPIEFTFAGAFCGAVGFGLFGRAIRITRTRPEGLIVVSAFGAGIGAAVATLAVLLFALSQTG